MLRDTDTSTFTFFFSDIEDSTRLWEANPDAMRVALARHDQIARQTIHDHGGSVFKTTGDGVCATFTTTPDAARAAAALQRSIDSEHWPESVPIAVRIGVHRGSAENRDGDYFGPALNRTSRIMSAAHGGQTVLSDSATEDVRTGLSDDLGIVDLGTHRLRGLNDPERIHQLTISGLPSGFAPLSSVDAFPAARPTPDRTLRRDGGRLVGRESELAVLEKEWRGARRGSRRVVLVAGEPGIGKTRLVAEVADLIESDAGFVLYGLCDENAVVPYQPFVEALRDYIASVPVTVLHERLRGLEHDLARVVPELEGRLREPPVRETPGDARAERYRLFEAVVSVVTGLSAAGPTALVLDDLHWADETTMLLLRHLLRSTSDAALLVVGCYSDTEVPRGHPTADLLADLRGTEGAIHISLDGLSDDESALLLNDAAGHAVPPDVVDALHDQTDGNPLFLVEILKGVEDPTSDPVASSAVTGADITHVDLPERARDVVARRVRRLPEDVGSVLAATAVIGSVFTSALVGEVLDLPERDVLSRLDITTDAGLVAEQPGRSGSYSFAHAFIRQTIYLDLPTARRAGLHADVAATMERFGTERYPPAVLAHHYTRALPLGDHSKAVGYTLAAGRDAVDDLAFEKAAALFEQARELAEKDEAFDTSEWVEILIEHAGALVFVDEGAAVDTARRAIDEARRHGSPEQLARAVTVLTEPVSAVVADPERTIELFDEAQRGLRDDDHALRARLLAIEAFKYAAYQLHGRNPQELARVAVDEARKSDDPVTLAEALFARATSLETEPDVSERVAIADELVSLGRAESGRASTATAYGLRVLAGANLDVGNDVDLAAAVSELTRVGHELRWLPALVYEAQWRATLATVEARFDDVSSCWADMRRYARAYRGVGGMIGQQSLFLAREQGRFAEYLGSLQDVAAANPSNAYVGSLLALSHLDSDDTAGATAALDDLAEGGFRQDVGGGAWPVVLGVLAEVAVATESAAHVETLHQLVEPFSGTLLTAVVGLGCIGSADRYLGMLCAARGDHSLAQEHFQRAVEIENRVKGRALLARTRYWQARSLGARGSEHDRSDAEQVLSDVERETRDLGMRRLEQQAATLRNAIRSGA